LLILEVSDYKSKDFKIEYIKINPNYLILLTINKNKIHAQIFKVVAILEGISYLALFSNMLFIKPNNFDLYKTLSIYRDEPRVLFIGYVIVATLLKNLKIGILRLSNYLLASPLVLLYREKYCANV
jgi:hypothetical protein